MKGLNIFFAIPPVANLLSLCCPKFTGFSQNIVVSLLILRDKFQFPKFKTLEFRACFGFRILRLFSIFRQGRISLWLKRLGFSAFKLKVGI
jgi:hypothetical protein